MPCRRLVSPAVLSLLAVVGGCGGETGIKTSSAPPPVEKEVPSEEMTAAKLRKLLGDDRVQVEVRGDRIRGLQFQNANVSDIEPLRGLELTTVDLYQQPIDDISPLEGMPLEHLKLTKTNVTELSPLEGMPLKTLDLIDTPVTDISVVTSLDLEILWLRGSRVRDLSPLAGQKLESLDVQNTDVTSIAVAPRIEGLERLNIVDTPVTDLTPLEGLRLTRLLFTPSQIEKGLDVVRNMKSLTQLDVEFREQGMLDPKEFWKRYDAGEFDKQDDAGPQSDDE